MKNSGIQFGCHSGFGMMSIVTYPMLVDLLTGYEILHEPKQRLGHFRWAADPRGLAVKSIFDANETIFVSDAEESAALYANMPEAFQIVLTDGDIPEWAFEDAARVIVLKRNGNRALLQELQARFLNIQNTSSRLESSIAANATVEEVFGIAQMLVDATLVVVSKNRAMYSKMISAEQRALLDHLRGVEHPDVGKDIEDGGTFVFQGVHYHVLLKTLSQPDGAVDLEAAAFAGAAPTEGQIDAFRMFSARIEAALYGKELERDLVLKDPNAILNKLVRNAYVSRARLSAFVNETRLEGRTDLRILGIDLTGKSAAAIRQIEYLALRSFGNCLAHTREGNFLLLLLYSNGMDGMLSNNSLKSIVRDKICPEQPVVAAASQVFEKLPDCHFAYKEIGLIFNHANFNIVANRFLANDEGEEKCFYSFEECFLYELIENKEMDPTFRDFCLSHTVLERLFAEDQASGNEDVRILLMYQYYSRRASVVAEKLHMHRNTVLYHIDKIQKRFDFDLSDPAIEERLMVDAKALFRRLAASPKELEEYLGPVRKS